MKFEVLGTGGAVSTLPTAYLINDTVLVDCGLEIIKKLYKEKRLNQIKTIFITHLHMDHVSGFEFFTFFKRFAKETFTVYAGSNFNEFYKSLACSKEYGTGDYQQDFKIMNFVKNDNNGFELENNLHVNKTNTIHMGGAVESYAFTFIDGNRNSRVIISGDTDKPLALISATLLESTNSYLFHDMGMTGWGQSNTPAHPTEEEVFNEFGHSERIYGIHTDFDLKIYQKAEEKIYLF
jgi:ribonuclease BN (tRNA processing enzyme)